MDITDYSKIINKEIEKISNSNVVVFLNITIMNFEEYYNYFKERNEILSIKSDDFLLKLKVLNDLNSHSSFLISGIIQNIITNNFIISQMILRALIEYYAKYIFILKNDDFVAKSYSDSEIYEYDNRFKNDNLPKERIDKIKEIKKSINLNYGIEEDKEFKWLKYSLEKINNKKCSGTFSEMFEFLNEKKYLDNWIYKNYKDSCEYLHIGANSLEELQFIDSKIDNGEVLEEYIQIILCINHIMWHIYRKYIEIYDEKYLHSKNCMGFFERMKSLIKYKK